MMPLLSALESAKNEFSSALQKITALPDLEKLRITFLGRNGTLTDLMAQLKTASLEEKKACGPLLNTFKKEITTLLSEKQIALQKEHELHIQKKHESFDVTASIESPLKSKLHIYTQIIHEIESIFISMGYALADGPELETATYNFTALNIANDHPARDMHDTFWINDTHLLRTHTTTMQIHQMKNNKPPLAIASVGRVFRNEATDASHEFMFTQYEGLFISTQCSLSDLIGTLESFIKSFFKKDSIKIRVRPGYFPFVEPGLEIDASCPFCTAGCAVCKHTQWIELLGAGLIHPHVLKQCNIDPEKYTGFAFGGGLERLAGIKHGINDVRLFHSKKITFLDQF